MGKINNPPVVASATTPVPGKSAFEIWLEQPGNAGKTLAEFIDFIEADPPAEPRELQVQRIGDNLEVRLEGDLNWTSLGNIKGAPGATINNNQPRGTGGTIGRLTTRVPGSTTRTDITLGWTIEQLAGGRVALIDADNRVIERGQTGRVTGIPGFAAGSKYYLGTPISGTATNLTEVPGNWPNNRPPAPIWNVDRPFYLAGECFADGAELYFTHYADARPARTTVLGAVVWTLDLLTPPLNTALDVVGPNQRWERIWNLPNAGLANANSDARIITRVSGIIDRPRADGTGTDKVVLMFRDYDLGRYLYSPLGMATSTDSESIMILESSRWDAAPGVGLRILPGDGTTRRGYTSVMRSTRAVISKYTPGVADLLNLTGRSHTGKLIKKTKIEGSNIRFKIWAYDDTKTLAQQGDNEPTAWTGEYTAATEFTEGRWGFHHEGNVSNYLLWARHSTGTVSFG